MTFLKVLSFSAAFTLAVFFSSFDHTSAQTGVCTNFTCRYGECEQFPTTYVCHCPAQVKGQNCDYRMQAGDSLCLSNPCWNGGTCNDLGTDWYCTCPSGATGKDCRQITTAACQFNNPCRNNAVCMVNPASNGVFCVCTGAWTGSFCETPVTLCSIQTPCYNGGSCINNICVCQANFTGFQCETYRPVNTDHVIKILNKGWYLADIWVDYEQQSGLTKFPVQQRGQIGLNGDYAFYVPRSVVLEGELGIVFTAWAVAGVRIFSIRVPSTPLCVHTWGTTLFPAWTFIDCAQFKS